MPAFLVTTASDGDTSSTHPSDTEVESLASREPFQLTPTAVTALTLPLHKHVYGNVM